MYTYIQNFGFLVINSFNSHYKIRSRDSHHAFDNNKEGTSKAFVSLETKITSLQAQTVDMVAIGFIKTISTNLWAFNAVFGIFAFCQNKSCELKTRFHTKKVLCSNVFNTQWVLVTLLSKLRRIYYRWILSNKIVHVILLTPRHHYSMCPCTIDWSLKTTLILSIKVICCKLIWNDNLASTFVYS